MGEAFGHIVPGIFYSVIAIFLLFVTRSNRDEFASFDFSKGVKSRLGWAMLVTGGFGTAIEGIGGVLHNGDFLFQLAHEAMYAAFAVAGVVCVLEGAGRMPLHSWQFSLCMGFFVEGLVFYGHGLEQTGVEQMLHLIMVFFSWCTAFCFFLCCVLAAWASEATPQAANRALFTTHVVGLTFMLAKGLWFFITSDILYSGKFGLDGVNFMIADEFVYAGLLLVSLFGTVGIFIFMRPAGAYDAEEQITAAGEEVEKTLSFGA